MDYLEKCIIKKDLEKKRIWKLETLPCSTCCTTGRVVDSWSRIQICSACNGKGRQKINYQGDKS